MSAFFNNDEDNGLTIIDIKSDAKKSDKVKPDTSEKLKPEFTESVTTKYNYEDTDDEPEFAEPEPAAAAPVKIEIVFGFIQIY